MNNVTSRGTETPCVGAPCGVPEEDMCKRLADVVESLRAVLGVDLEGLNKDHPLPWHLDERELANGDFADRPIYDENGKFVVVRDSGFFPPSIPACKAIVACVNTVWEIQKKIGGR